MDTQSIYFRAKKNAFLLKIWKQSYLNIVRYFSAKVNAKKVSFLPDFISKGIYNQMKRGIIYCDLIMKAIFRGSAAEAPTWNN